MEKKKFSERFKEYANKKKVEKNIKKLTIMQARQKMGFSPTKVKLINQIDALVAEIGEHKFNKKLIESVLRSGINNLNAYKQRIEANKEKFLSGKYRMDENGNALEIRNYRRK